MKTTLSVPRRKFLTQTVLAASAAAGWRSLNPLAAAADQPNPPIALFSKVYQELKLDYVESAAMTADAGLDGIDCPVRPGGQVLPDRVGDDLPRYVDELRKRNVKLLLLTTAITSTATPHAEAILRTAQKFGVKYYRLGYWNYQPDQPATAQLKDIKAQLKDLAALNRELGTCAIMQNHAGAKMVGAKVWDLYEIARAFDPDQVAIAFDLGHAIHELAQNWRTEFEKLKSHFRVAYVKDWKRGADFVAFGEGEIGPSGFFTLLKNMNYHAPISMHTEYEWAGKGNERTKAGLLQALRKDRRVLQNWRAAA